MNTIDNNITLSSRDLDALDALGAFEPPVKPVLDDAVKPAAPPAVEAFKDAGIDAVDAPCVDSAFVDAAALPEMEKPIEHLVIELPAISLALSTFRRYATSLANLLSSVRSMILRTPAFRPDSQLAERLTRTQEDFKKDDSQKIDLRRKLVTQEPVEVTTTQSRTSKRVGDEIVTEVITTEHHTRSLVSGEGKVVGTVESVQTRDEVMR